MLWRKIILLVSIVACLCKGMIDLETCYSGNFVMFLCFFLLLVQRKGKGHTGPTKI